MNEPIGCLTSLAAKISAEKIPAARCDCIEEYEPLRYDGACPNCGLLRGEAELSLAADELRREMERLGVPTDGVDFEKLAQMQNDKRRRVPGWEAPRVMPPNWREVMRADDGGAKYVNSAARLAVIFSCSVESDGRAWLHLSVSHASRVPSWGELRVAKELFLGDREAYSILPPRARYVNLHNNVLHLFALLEEGASALPDFTCGTGSL